MAAFNLFDWHTWNQPPVPPAPAAAVGSYGALSSGPYSNVPTGGGVMYRGQEMPNYPGYYWNTPKIADTGTAGGITATSPDPNASSTSNPYGMTNQQMQDYLLGNKPMSEAERAKLEQEKWMFLNPQSQAISAYQQQQLANQQQSDAQTVAYQQAQLAYAQQRDTADREAAKQQRLATLSAQPKSWLEYAALANQPPAVQPWMLPLMPQDYQQTQPVGSAISGWTPENMRGMPDLINPSAQYLARMGPTAQQQYYGYQQADQGITPEEQQFRLWSQGPPGGSYQGLRQTR